MWLDSDGVVTDDKCWQHGDYTVDQLCSHRAASRIVISDYTSGVYRMLGVGGGAPFRAEYLNGEYNVRA